MKILHVAHIKNDPCDGVCAAVPKHIIAQQDKEDVALVNLTNVAIPNVINQYPYHEQFDPQRLPAPFGKPDIVVFHELYRPPYLKIYRQLQKCGIPYVIIPHGGFAAVAQKKKYLKKLAANALLFHRFFKGAVAIQYLSVAEQQNSVYRFPSFIGTNGIPLPAACKQSFSQKGLRLLFIGRYEVPIKGIDLLLEAVHKGKELFLRHGIVLDLYGTDTQGGRAAIADMIKTYDIEPYVCVHGPIVGEEKEQALLQADCFIQTSRSEGVPMGILEALSYGLPCIVTKGTGLADTLENARAGFGCETSADDILSAIERAAARKHMFPDMSVCSRRLIQQRYERDRIAKQTIKNYTVYAKNIL